MARNLTPFGTARSPPGCGAVSEIARTPARLLVHVCSAAGRGTAPHRSGWAAPPLNAEAQLVSQSAGVRLDFETPYTAQALPFGAYLLRVSAPGFRTHTEAITISSEIPVSRTVTLGVAPVETVLTIQDSSTLLDPARTGNAQIVGADRLQDRRSAAPGRSVLEMVNMQPGWLLEANGVLHPRGSEYDTQYVIDGIPLFENRSPNYAQSLGVEEYSQMRMLTGGYPAEYGRKLGGVVEVATSRDARPGIHGKAALQGGSFATRSGYAAMQVHQGKTTFGVSGEGMLTDRYLDAPVEENYTNRGSGGGFSARLEQDWTASARTRFYAYRRRTGFLVPNELLQQQAGQRQDRTAEESLGQITHQQILSPRTLLNVRFMARDNAAALWSNSLSIPVAPSQDRGFRDTYLNATLAHQRGRHELKAGFDANFASIHEDFGYRITHRETNGFEIFDDDAPTTFQFRARAPGREQSAFLQDRIRLGRLTIHAGVRFDHYRIVLAQHAWSPRFAAAYSIPKLGLVLRASYDRVFQTPAVENLLLASRAEIGDLGGEGLRIPIAPGSGNFWETGFSKSLGSRIRLDGSAFRRNLRNFADDGVLYNTGVSFPITFARGIVKGYEAKLEVPRWGRFTGYASYSNMHAVGSNPVTGGLFLGDEAEEAIESRGSFAITQDQRNTARAWLRSDLTSRVWLALSGRYNSGLPFELEGASQRELLLQQYGERILNRVNFSRGRVRPSSSVDASLGVTLLQSEANQVTLQADAFNLADRLNVINFSGLFSGTALEPRRSFALRLQVQF